MLVFEKEEVSKRKGKCLTDPDYVSNLSKGFAEALVTGKFCDVKIICQDSNLWAHRLVLSTVSPFLTNLLIEMEKRGDDVITIFLPRIKGYHMKLVLDYIYSGTMYLCGAHMQYVIQVMEVLNLNCGVSVNKMVQSTTADEKWIEVEHSTMKIKSNFPPSLPEFGGEQSDGQSTTCSIPPGTSCLPATRPAPAGGSGSGQLSGNKPAKELDKIEKDGREVNLEKSKAKESSVSTDDQEPKSSAAEESEEVVESEQNEDVCQTETSAADVSSDSVPDIVDIPASVDDDDFEKDREEAEEKADEVGGDDTNVNDEESREHVSTVVDTEELQEGNTDVDTPAADDDAIGADDDAITDGDVFAGSDDDDDDDDDEPVMVEIDEHFAVDSLTSSQAEQNEGKKHKCALCGRMFRFYENLRVHLTGHLGVKVTLSRCRACKRNFKNQTELELHMKAHSYARHLGKYRLAKSAAEAERAAKAASEAKIITTVGTRDKKIIRKYTKNRSAAVNVLTRKRDVPVTAAASSPAPADDGRKSKSSSSPPTTAGHATPDSRVGAGDCGGPTSGQQFSCNVCDKSFIVKSLYSRHMRQKHDFVESQKSEEVRSPASVVTSSRGKRHSLSSLPPSVSSPAPTSSRKENPYSRQYSTPSRKRDKSESSDFSPPLSAAPTPPMPKRRRIVADTPKSAGTSSRSSGSGSRSSGDNNLKCPDCDKIFVAKTILERHQYTAKHGVYGTYSSDSGPGSPSVQHVTERQVDCHLCGQVFLRVKDLVKHREKVCTAWLNPGT